MERHKNIVIEIIWLQKDNKFISCSKDCSLVVWDCKISFCFKKLFLQLHFINCIRLIKSYDNLMISGDDECKIKLWDAKVKELVLSIENGAKINMVLTGDLSKILKIGILETQY